MVVTVIVAGHFVLHIERCSRSAAVCVCLSVCLCVCVTITVEQNEDL